MIQYLLFDLDNTLYSARYGLERNVDRRIIAYMASYLGLSLEEAAKQRREGIKFYGTTLEWLRNEKGLSDVEAYYAATHPEGEADTLPPNPMLRSFLESLPLPRAILTNSPREHVDRILNKLEIPEDLFTHIFDIRRNGFKGKPNAEVFYQVLAVLGTKPETTLFIDDYPPYMEGYLALGGKGLLLDEENAYPDYPHPRIRELWELTSYLK
ncbi:MAG: HAD-IA family hydrolase [Treponema sp.]|jgi:putative hydrolase of the HAD superfamily|nr:HAD-IA family hydrolase [Treponema sp.]